jgi:hypothetical protein
MSVGKWKCSLAICFAYRLYDYTPLLRIFLQIDLLNMGQILSVLGIQPLSVQETYITPLLLTFPEELIGSFELILAKTCKTLYERYEQYYKMRTAVILYDPHNELPHTQNIKALQSHHRWLRLKFDSTWNSQTNSCPIKYLCLYGAIGAPEKLDLGCVTSLMIGSSSVKELMPTIPIIKKFTNLGSLSLDNVILCSNGISMLSKLSLKFIYLKRCNIDGHLQEIFENYTALQEIQLLSCNHSALLSIKLYSQLKRFKIEDDGLREVDASMCIQLESL